MRKAKVVWKIVTAVVIVMAGLTFMGCEKNSRTVPQTAVLSEKEMVRSSTDDPRVIIGGLQQEFIQAGVPLTDEQQELIMDVDIPVSRRPLTHDLFPDLRSVFDVLTQDQKRVIVTMYREALAETELPLTKRQEARIMAFGKGSKDTFLVGDIITPEQDQTMFRMAIERNRTNKAD